ncbi:MAG TPA: hypothetical protein VFG21_02235 [Xanthomonadaceae bacterium]|nr:hypothetical protein [Xanthomonadaceae bacterium]
MAAADDPDVPVPAVHRADPAYRRYVVIALLLVVGAGAVALWLLVGWLAQAPGDASVFRRHALLVALFGSVCFAMALPLGAFGVWLMRLARRIDVEGRFPPQDMHTTRDYPVATGADARRQARLHLALAVLAFALAALLVGWGAWVYLNFAP